MSGRTGRPMSLLAVVLLLGGAVLVAYAPEAEAATSRSLTISTASAGPADRFQRFDGHPPKAFDFNGDGRKEIIVHNDNKHVYVFDSKDGRLLADLTTRHPSGWGARPLNGVEAAVMQDGTAPYLIVANSAAYVTAFRYDGSGGDGFHFTKVWERRLDTCGEGNPGMDSRPVLADLNNDGRLEILGYTEEVGGYALRMDGSVMWKTCIGGGNSAPAVKDMNFDGTPEVVWASDGGVITVSNGASGRTQWTFWAGDPKYNLGTASIVQGASIGQIDGAGPLDIAFGARDSHDHDELHNNHAALFAVNGHGGLLWMRQDLNGGAPLTHTLPIIHDVDGNGKMDILWADWNTMGHKPPPPDSPDAFKRTGPAHFYRYDAAGNMLWKTTLETYWNNKDLALGDVDGDGVQEVLANGPGSGGDGIWYLNSRTGAKETFVSTHPWKVTRAPVLSDLWGTGTMQWVVQVEAADGSVSGGGVQVYDTHVGYNAAWPGPPGPSKATGSPPPPPPPSGGTFDATFTIKAPNEWWQEVYVKPDTSRTITDVKVSINDGSWLSMSKSSWGAWTSSYHATAGSSVKFQARDAGGATSTSAPFTWMDGTTSKRSDGSGGGGGGGGGDFDARFTVPSGVNEWWVEVKVDSSQSVSKVTARVNNDSPVTLSKTSWGTWAKSFHVPAGSSVVFTATSSTGATATSSTYTWLGGGSGGSGGSFDATFKVSDTTNNWWVETSVTANKPVTKVEARVDGGAWRDLPKTDWGTWAKSFRVEDGSKVQFRAHDGSGATDLSGSYTWG